MSRRLLPMPLVLVVVLLVSSCGIGPDEAPQAISPSSLPPALFNTQTGSTAATGDTATIFVVTGQGDAARLTIENVSIDPTRSEDRTTQAIRSLLTYTPDQSAGLSSPVSGTELRATRDLGSATIEVSLGSLSVEARPLQQAMAQIVFTATQDSPFNNVRLVVNDKAVPAPDSAASDRALTRSDFSQFSPERPLSPTTSRVR